MGMADRRNDCADNFSNNHDFLNAIDADVVSLTQICADFLF